MNASIDDAKDTIQITRSQADCLITLMPQLRDLNVEQARALMALPIPNPLILSGLKRLSFDVATVLAHSCRDVDINLSGLEQIAAKPAKPLAACKTGVIFLGGLKSIQPDVAAAITGREFKFRLIGLEKLTIDVATALAKSRGYLSLPAIRTLPQDVARILGNSQFSHLALSGLESLTPQVAEALARHRGGTLSLDGLKSITPEVAGNLAFHRGFLSLKGLRSLSADSAVRLMAHSGCLNLEGLVRISNSAARAIKERFRWPENLTASQLNDIWDKCEIILPEDFSHLCPVVY